MEAQKIPQSDALTRGPMDDVYSNLRFTFLPLIWRWREGSTNEDELYNTLAKLGFDLQPGGWNITSASSGLKGVFLPENWRYSSGPLEGIINEKGVVIAENAFEGKSPNAVIGDNSYAHLTAILKPSLKPNRLYFNRELIEESLCH